MNMNEDLLIIEERTRREKINNFYKKNKSKIFSFLIIIFLLIISIFFYFDLKGKKKLGLSDKYIEASILLKKGDKLKAKEYLEDIILSNDITYSPLSLFLIVSENLNKNDDDLIKLFDHVIENNKLEEEMKNLIIFKKGVVVSAFEDENKILNALNPLVNSESFWKPHALILLGDYFFNKNDLNKAKEFYREVFLIPNVGRNLFNQANSRLGVILSEQAE